MGDRWATIDTGQKQGAVMPPFVWELSPHLTRVARAEVYLHTKWHLDPSSRLATIHGTKMGTAVPPFLGEMGSHLTQCRLGRGLPPYQMTF